ncbi:DegT/DnrJ/EryC1/StrS family aminotransferase [Candidatus Saccharibacteria bacterium]|nr:DegT/DnrJ/EryC1/StrS family aminotransferase [Candidatus Saccharibacteria bacterium]
MITKSAQDKSAFTKGLLFTQSARSAWRLIIESLQKSQGSVNILLPSYIGFTEREGSGIFDPVQATEANYSFYDLNEDLSINFEAFRKLIETKRFNIACVVHYFGFCRNDMNKIKRLCKKNNVILVEDCAHAFQIGLNAENLGVVGDFSIYSLHKHLATDNGGILRNVSGSCELIDLPEDKKISLDASLQLLNSDLEAIATIRRENYMHFAIMLSAIDGLEMMYELQDGEVPQSFPVRIKNGLREQLYFHLMDLGIPTIALYYRLIDELDVSSYPLANKISNEILNLPVHQDITTEDVSLIVGEVKKFMESKV